MDLLHPVLEIWSPGGPRASLSGPLGSSCWIHVFDVLCRKWISPLAGALAPLPVSGLSSEVAPGVTSLKVFPSQATETKRTAAVRTTPLKIQM